MNLVLSIISWTFTVVLGVVLVGGIFGICRSLVRRQPVPVLIWSAVAQIAFFFAGGVILIATHGHGSKAVQLLSMAGIAAAWPRL